MSEQPKKRGRPRKNPLPEAAPAGPSVVTATVDGSSPEMSVPEGDDVEMSEKEVEEMLLRMDREAAGLPEPPVIDPTPVIELAPGQPHALDDAPVNSKIVVTDEGAVLAQPSGVSMLPKSDPASRLPKGARIVKAGPVLYIASQLSATWFVEPKNYTSAGAAVADFVKHFHPREQ